MASLAAIGIVSADIAESCRFYRTLGLDVPAEGGFAGKKEPYDAFRGQRYANVTDPDGNVVDLFAPL
jgi:hypothetical protein